MLSSIKGTTGRRFVACAAACVLLAPAAGAVAAPAPKLSPKLVGTWTRTVTPSDIARGKPLIPASILENAACKLAVKSSGSIRLDCGRSVAQLNGSITALSATNVRILLGDGAPNSYRWTVAGKKLTLTSITDPSHDRVTIFRGTWQRH